MVSSCYTRSLSIEKSVDKFQEVLSESQNALSWRDKMANKLRIQNQLLRLSLAEFFATFCLVVFSQSAAASVVFSGRQNDILLVSVGQGLCVTFAVYVAGGVSGSVMNPALCVAFASLGRLRWVNCICFSIAEYLGAFTACLLSYSIHYESLNKYDGGVRTAKGPNMTANIFTTFPTTHRSLGGAFFHSVMCASFLLIVVLALIDNKNWAPKKRFFPFAMGSFIMLIVVSFSFGEALALNPATDFAARIFTLLAGYGNHAFSSWDYSFFWIPVIGTHLGAIMGAWTYILVIEIHHPPVKHEF